MLDRILTRALSKSDTLRSFVEGELERLSEEGFLSGADLEELRAEQAKRLEGFAAGAGGQANQVLQGLGDTLRAALDIPSRAEILALTEELRQARERAEQGSGP